MFGNCWYNLFSNKHRNNSDEYIKLANLDDSENHNKNKLNITTYNTHDTNNIHDGINDTTNAYNNKNDITNIHDDINKCVEPVSSHIDLSNNTKTSISYVTGLNVDFSLEPGRFCCFNINGIYKTVYIDKECKHIRYGTTITDNEKELIKPFIKEYLELNK